MGSNGSIAEVLEAEEATEAESYDPEGPHEEEVPEEEADAEAGEPNADPDDVAEPAELAPTADIVRIGTILGVPLWWEHTNPGPRNFPVARAFIPTLEATVRQVRERAPAAFGPLKRINSAGLYVAKPGEHGRGRACDWDRLIFGQLEIAPRAFDHASPSLAKRRRYWAFAAICRSNCAYVLHGEHDADHRNHVHQDDGGDVRFRSGVSSTVKLCQAILNEIFGTSPRLAIDGGYGPKTQAALRDALETLQLSGDVSDLTVWRKFLRRSARLGFRLSIE